MIDGLLMALDQACRNTPEDLARIELLMRANGVRSIGVNGSHFERRHEGGVAVTPLPARASASQEH